MSKPNVLVVVRIPNCAVLDIRLGRVKACEIAVPDMFVPSVILLTSVPTAFLKAPYRPP